jgi:hypothetical protein
MNVVDLCIAHDREAQFRNPFYLANGLQVNFQDEDRNAQTHW